MEPDAQATTAAPAQPPIIIKKYANRRLYNTASSSYVTLENLADMVHEGLDFVVYDARSGEDLTRSVLTQIIVEQEGKAGQNLLPIGFLRQLIGFYGNNMQWLVPGYLDHAMRQFTDNQEHIKSYYQTTFGSLFPFGNLEEVGKQNMAMFERAMRFFSPFNLGPFGKPQDGAAASGEKQDAVMPTGAPSAEPPRTAPWDKAADSLGTMQNKLTALQAEVANLSKKK